MMKKVLVPVTDGTEELEAIAIIDILRRADVHVNVASTTGDLKVTCSRGVPVIADSLISHCRDETFDMIVLPGGIPGAMNLRDSEILTEMLKKQVESGGFYGAICASPAIILEHHGLLKNKNATCHPGFADHMTRRDKTRSLVVVDGNCVTSRGAGTAIDFALQLVEILAGTEKRRNVEGGLAIVS